MLPNGSIKSLSRSEKMFVSVSGNIGNYAYTFQVRNCKDLMRPNRSIKSLSRSRKMFGSVSGSIRKFAYTVSSAGS